MKLEKLRSFMKKENIEVCVFKNPENLVMYTGYWPRNGFSYFVVGQNAEPMLVTPKGDQDDYKYGRIDNVKQFGFIKIKDGNPYENISKILVDYKEENKIADGCIVGMDIGFEVVSVPICSGEITNVGDATIDTVKKSFSTEKVVSAAAGIVECRAIKNEFDIEKLEIVNELAIMATEHFKSIVKPGMREIDIAAEVEAFFAKTASGFKGTRYGKAWAQISSGTKTAKEAWYAGVVSENIEIKEGDMVMLEMGAVVDGYWTDLTRVCVCGKPSDKQKEVIEIVAEAQRLAKEAIKPGAVANDVYQVAMDYITSKGYGQYYPHGLGHGLGFMYHEAIPGVGPGSDVVFEEGMVMSCEPGIYIDGEFGVRLEDNVLVTKDGHKVLGK